MFILKNKKQKKKQNESEFDNFDAIYFNKCK